MAHLSPESIVLERKWRATNGGNGLPPYEEIALGGLGRLADNMLVMEQHPSGIYVTLRCGPGLKGWLGDKVEMRPIATLPAEFADPLRLVLDTALATMEPASRSAYRVRAGMVEPVEFLAMPLACRWGRTLLAAHVARVGESFNLVDTIFRSAEEGIAAFAVSYDSDGELADFQIVAINGNARDLLSSPGEPPLWRFLSELESDLDIATIRAHLLAARRTGAHQQFEISIKRDGRSYHMSVGAAAAGDLISTTWTDITEIRQREESFRLLFDCNPVPMWLYNPETLAVVNVNEAAISHYGYSRDEFMVMHVTDFAPDAESLLVTGSSSANCFSDLSQTHVKRDGSRIDVLTCTRPLTLEDRETMLLATIDVTERRRAEARISFLAHHDTLTRLPNRFQFHERLSEALAHVKKHEDCALAIHCIDLDHFKTVNDTLGHPVGDELLRAVAERLADVIAGKGLVARLGGDEFAVIQTNLATPDQANALANEIVAAVGASYEIHGHEVVVGASIGIALAPSDGVDPDTLLRNADMALYRAKAEGRGTVHFFEPGMDRLVQARRVLEMDLRRAIAKGEFELHYQPLVELTRRRIVGFEALLRWNHPTRGQLAPNDFVPLAEETGLITAIGQWVLRQACRDAMTWPAALSVAVNLSAVQFRGRTVVDDVTAALAASGLPAERLELEITETVLLANTKANLEVLHRLRDLGARVSMDDFGTGYSSLSYLRSFPFDKIKIDRSFVSDLGKRSDSLAIIQAVLGLGTSLGIATIAEGVETEAQLDRLIAEGCREGQGHLFSRPRPAAAILDLLPKPVEAKVA